MAGGGRLWLESLARGLDYTYPTAMPTSERITLATLSARKKAKQPIAMLTAYDHTFAQIVDAAGVDCILVGDSAAQVILGHDSTLPVTLEDMVYHTRCVVRGSQRALVVGDLSFGSYQQSPQQAFASAAQLMAAGAGMASKYCCCMYSLIWCCDFKK